LDGVIRSLQLCDHREEAVNCVVQDMYLHVDACVLEARRVLKSLISQRIESS
jgi:hypothetical protein